MNKIYFILSNLGTIKAIKFKIHTVLIPQPKNSLFLYSEGQLDHSHLI